MSDIEVLLVSRCQYDSRNAISIPVHSHTFHHFICVISGNGEITVQEQRCAITHNMVFLIKPGVMHAIQSSGDNTPLKTMEIKFIDGAGWVNEVFHQAVLHLSNKEYKRIVSLLEKIIDEALSKNVLHERLITAYFQEILLLSARQQDTRQGLEPLDEIEPDNPKLTAEYKTIEKIVDHINHNYMGRLPLEDLSKITNYNKAYLGRLFKKLYGMTMTQYINNLRLQKAKELLMYSALSVAKVAEASGFQSIHYFSRFFKENEGMTPLELRSNVKKNVYVFFNNAFYHNELNSEHTITNKPGSLIEKNVYVI